MNFTNSLKLSTPSLFCRVINKIEVYREKTNYANYEDHIYYIIDLQIIKKQWPFHHHVTFHRHFTWIIKSADPCPVGGTQHVKGLLTLWLLQSRKHGCFLGKHMTKYRFHIPSLPDSGPETLESLAQFHLKRACACTVLTWSKSILCLEVYYMLCTWLCYRADEGFLFIISRISFKFYRSDMTYWYQLECFVLNFVLKNCKK